MIAVNLARLPAAFLQWFMIHIEAGIQGSSATPVVIVPHFLWLFLYSVLFMADFQGGELRRHYIQLTEREQGRYILLVALQYLTL